ACTFCDTRLLSLHGALPISNAVMMKLNPSMDAATFAESAAVQKDLIAPPDAVTAVGEMSHYRWQLLIEQLLDMKVIDQPVPVKRSEEHTSELQSREKLVCRL